MDIEICSHLKMHSSKQVGDKRVRIEDVALFVRLLDSQICTSEKQNEIFTETTAQSHVAYTR